MSAKPKAAKKSYTSPSLLVLDASAAKAILQSKGDSKDPVIQKMISFANEQINQRKTRPGSSSTKPKP